MKAFEIVERVDVPQDALDRQTGKEVWKAEWKGAMTVAGLGTSMGSWIRATPALDGKRLYVAGMPDLLVCLDPQSGAERWQPDASR
jgi:outer membrane protein assembly factor BamB|tara:strand:- start:879 stop:1136 length:258 start_codon:yes stop_codon:yes gene_type:complete